MKHCNRFLGSWHSKPSAISSLTCIKVQEGTPLKSGRWYAPLATNGPPLSNTGTRDHPAGALLPVAGTRSLRRTNLRLGASQPAENIDTARAAQF